MKEKPSKLVDSIKAVKEAVELRLSFGDKNGLNVWNYLSFPEKAYINLHKLNIALQTLKPAELKTWVLAASSVNYGKSLLDEVFPKYENPDDYHSRSGITVLNEHPVQVLGYKEYWEKHQKGIKEFGLIDEYISLGFGRRAEERGIDLEWSFHGEVPKANDQTKPAQQLPE
jgi:hypothetical protein